MTLALSTMAAIVLGVGGSLVAVIGLMALIDYAPTLYQKVRKKFVHEHDWYLHRRNTYEALGEHISYYHCTGKNCFEYKYETDYFIPKFYKSKYNPKPNYLSTDMLYKTMSNVSDFERDRVYQAIMQDLNQVNSRHSGSYPQKDEDLL